MTSAYLYSLHKIQLNPLRTPTKQLNGPKHPPYKVLIALSLTIGLPLNKRGPITLPLQVSLCLH